MFSWFEDIKQQFQLTPNIAAAIVGLFTICYFIYKRLRLTKYQSVEDNELLMIKLKAARLKQQEDYLKFQKEQSEKKTGQCDDPDSNSDNSGKPKTDNWNGGRLPLMSQSCSYYRPIKKRPYSGCGCG